MFLKCGNRKEAHKELQHRGYKIGKSKFYKDCSIGLCRLEADGSILESSLDEYIKNPIARVRRLGEVYEKRKAKEQRQGNAYLVIPVDLSLVWERFFDSKSSLNVGPTEDGPDE